MLCSQRLLGPAASQKHPERVHLISPKVSAPKLCSELPEREYLKRQLGKTHFPLHNQSESQVIRSDLAEETSSTFAAQNGSGLTKPGYPG